MRLLHLFSRLAIKWVTAILFWTTASIWAQPPFHPEIPKTWDAVALASLELPNPNPRYSPGCCSR
jgi:hypothetical protein